jgi:DedD protein
MPLPFFKRSKTEAAAPEAGLPAAGDEGTAVQAARTRARRRLIGAVVLLAAGVIGFPVLFETQPRPLPADLPIQVTASGTVGLASAPSRSVGKLVVPPPADAGNELPAAAGASSPDLDSNSASSPAPATAVTPVLAGEPARPATGSDPPRTAAVAETKAPPADPPKAVVAAAPKASAAAPKASAAAPSIRPPPGDAGRSPAAADKPKPADAVASARPDAPASAPKAAPRYVLQVGAFTDPGALRDARQRVEKLGFKTYTQVVETPAGARTRVRVGPFDTREEAERAGARLKSGGLPANLLTL